MTRLNRQAAKGESLTTAEIHKAAVLLLSLPVDQAAELLAQLDPPQAEAVTLEIARSDTISTAQQQAILAELADVERRTAGRGGFEAACGLVERAFGRLRTTAGKSRRPLGTRPCGFLQTVDARRLLALVIDEHAQTIALVLAHLPPSHRADILAGLPEPRRPEVVRRIAALGPTDPRIVRDVEHELQRRMLASICRGFDEAGSTDGRPDTATAA